MFTTAIKFEALMSESSWQFPKHLPHAIVLCFTFVFLPSIASEELPPGWRLPTAKELADDERNISATRFARAVADFNADGTADTALLLKSTRFSGEALWVRLSKGRRFIWVKLDEINWGREYPSMSVAMGIDVVPPGEIRYACYDHHKECDFGPPADRPRMTLISPGISYYEFESAASLYYWAKEEGKFLRVWLSD
jgi:hypothetical protein